MSIRPLRSQAPRRAAVAADADGRPLHVDGYAVAAIREEWRVEEGWWATPTRRRYFAAALDDGSLCVLYQDRRDGSWWRHGR